MHAFDRQTDGRSDRIHSARPRLHSMQRGKNDDDDNVGAIGVARIFSEGALFRQKS